MKISSIKCVLKYLTGGISGVVDYLLDALNEMLEGVDPQKKNSVTGAINITEKVLSSMYAFKWLCPTKWQKAYDSTLTAVCGVATALEDLIVTREELKNVQKQLQVAIDAWKSDDDDTCVDCVDSED